MQSTPTKELVYSDLAGDADLAELVEMFVDELPQRLELLRSQADAADWLALQRTAHQLKGSGGSYGFGQVSTTAAKLEASCKQEGPEQEILAAYEELESLCQRIRAGTPE